MSIPLDRLYHYIESIVEEAYGDNIVIYRFFPHGSKKVEDLTKLRELELIHPMADRLVPEMYCNDQEPLNYALYSNHTSDTKEILEACQTNNIKFDRFNFRGEVRTVWDLALLLHSEQRSTQIDLYRATNFIPVYYWSHAVIALDWFRFAQHVKPKKQSTKTFLIYNRAWSGTREYRLKFADLLIKLGLENDCKMSINPVEPELGIHYELHNFSNPMWRPTKVLENYFLTSDSHSHYSADFNIDDYNSTDIEVVLETLFDDNRLHLTEKSLRPIACAQPFIIAGTAGSLEYIRNYGFKTYNQLWDEQYDQIDDPQERLIAIASLMQQIANWDLDTRKNKMAQARIIAEYNRQLFFSSEFYTHIIKELQTNIANGVNELKEKNTSKQWAFRRPTLYKILLE